MGEQPDPAVVVLGSLHMDLIASAPRLPEPGESVADGRFSMAPGGKAGNQAVQLVRCGLRAQLVSRVGDDAFGRELVRAMTAAGVDATYLAVDPEAPTGASVVMTGAGDYMSIIAPGAAARLSRADVDAAVGAFGAMSALVVQLELPGEITGYAAARAAALGKMIVLNASPVPDVANDISHELFERATVLVVNRIEAGRLLGRTVHPRGAVDAAQALRERYRSEAVVVTLGSAGAVAISRDGTHVQPAFPVEVADTVGAGDAFLGALTAELVGGETLPSALRRAAAAGALAAGRRGAYDALPDRSAIDALLAGGSDRQWAAEG